ncbi:protein of unknown function ATP binding [Ignisphaera aggregans DSM 17230]|uniref:GTPase n=1 Tax=Ignisphaera aggregans (strain DSM 17230 / JCM 13409 / AQ1.S1) TaxID=583356 RepID=E0SQM4_IGNAA|nr:protein of unknown function ATP binding [Ignisphaera aggregans DSM 17230]
MVAIIIFLGPAGSGKSSLTSSYSRWLREFLGARIFIVNLDPATEFIPYKPDLDIRDLIDIHRISKEFGLGPNGVLVKAMDIIANEMIYIFEDLKYIDTDFILIDTPGQMEVFIFRDIAIKLVNELKKLSNNVVAVFVLDADVIKRYEDYAFISIMSTALQARMGIDVVPVINKIDLVQSLLIVGDTISDIDIVIENIRNKGLYGEMLSNILNIIWQYAKATRVPRVSAKEFIGIEELHRIIHELTCSCGDLT